MVFQIIIGILIVLAIILAALYYYQKRLIRQYEQINAQVKQLQEMKIEQHFEKVEQLKVTGDSKEQLEKLKKNYQDEVVSQEKKLASELETIKSLIHTSKVFSLAKRLSDLELAVHQLNDQCLQIKSSLHHIEELHQTHKRAIDQIKQRYRHFHHVLDEKSFEYGDSIKLLNDQLDDLETELLAATTSYNIRMQLQMLRKRYMEIKRTVVPLKDQYSKILHPDSELINETNRPFFSDVNDHLLNAVQLVEGCRETLSSLMDLYISNSDMRMNYIMKRLTVVSTIFIPLTFLVGVWGMNFKFMPELDWKYGYLMAWGVMIAAGVVSYLILRSRKWQ